MFNYTTFFSRKGKKKETAFFKALLKPGRNSTTIIFHSSWTTKRRYDDVFFSVSVDEWHTNKEDSTR